MFLFYGYSHEKANSVPNTTKYNGLLFHVLYVYVSRFDGRYLYGCFPIVATLNVGLYSNNIVVGSDNIIYAYNTGIR